MEPLLNVRNLTTHFDTERGVLKAVNGVSFSLNDGETLALVGESGSGKSVSCLSLLNLIPNPPGRIVNGEALFQGQDLLRTSEKDMRKIRGKKIAMIFQDPMTSLNPVLSIGRQLTESLELHMGMQKKEARNRAIELLDLVGIPLAASRIDHYPHQFSGGMCQRVMIAMALSCNPRLLIADEPTTALDVTIQAQILDLIRALRDEFGTAVIVVTHDLGVAAGLADRINVMYAGRIVESGSADDVFSDPRHPYTLGLMRSIPRMSGPREKLTPIKGMPPDMVAEVPGCPFAPRCDYAQTKCLEANPPLTAISPGHSVACWVDTREGVTNGIA